MENQTRVGRNTVIALVGVAVSGVVRLGFTLIVGRSFGVELLGVVSVVLAASVIVTIPVAGIAAAGNRFVATAFGSRDADAQRATQATTWRWATVAIAIGALAALIYLRFGTTNVGTLGIALGIVFTTAYGGYLTAKGLMFGSGQASRYMVGELVGFAGFVVVAGVVAFSDVDPHWILASQVVWAAATFGAALTVRLGPTAMRGPAPRGYGAFASTATLGSLLSLGLTQATVIVAAMLYGDIDAGFVSAAIAVTGPLYLLPRGLSLALTPAMSFRVGEGRRDRANLDARFLTNLLVVWGGLAIVSLFALVEIVIAVYGAEFGGAQSTILVFGLAAFVSVVGIPVVNRCAAEGGRAFTWTVIASGIGAVAAIVIWLIPSSQGSLAIANGFLVASVIKVVIPFASSRRLLGEWILPSAGVMWTTLGVVLAALALPSTRIAMVPIMAAFTVVAALTHIGRFRSEIAGARPEPSPLRVGVLTNMMPLPDAPHFGIFVQQRIDAYVRHGAEVIVIGPRRRSGRLKYAALLFDTVRSVVTKPIPDVYEVHPTLPTGVIALVARWLTRRPYVLYAHGSDVVESSIARGYAPLASAAIRRAAEVHTNSPFTKAAFEERWPAAPHPLVIPPGVETNALAPVERDLDIVFVGNLIPRKGAGDLIDAVGMMPDRPSLTIGGEGESRVDLEAAAASHHLNVSFLGRIDPDDVRALMARARVVAVPSHVEGLGQVAIEALSVGTPVVVTDCGGLSAIPTPECGSVIPVGDAPSLAKALEFWLTITPEAHAEAARHARERATDFDIDVVSETALQRFEVVARS